MSGLIARFSLVCVGFIVAAAVGLVTLFVLGSAWIGELVVVEDELGPALWPIAPVIGSFLFAGTVAPALTAVPGLVAIIIGEGLEIRSFVYYVFAGATALAAIPLLTGRDDPNTAAFPASDYFVIFLAAGAAAGLVYWAIAGRSA